MSFNHILLSLILYLIPLLPTPAAAAETTTTDKSKSSTSHSSSSSYHLPTLNLNSLDNKIYYTNVSVGDPGQDLQLRIDIIQGQSWVMDSEYFITCDERYDSNKTNQSALHHADVDFDIAVDNVCASQGLYNVSKSKSVNFFNNDYQASNDSTDEMYTDSSELNYIEIEGMILQDKFHFTNQSITLTNMNFVAANYSNVLAGGLGLAPNGIGNNFLQSLINNDIINSSSYSLYLGRVDAVNMELHLGGLDTSKLKGEFVEFDFIPLKDCYGSITDDLPIVPLTGLGVTSEGTGLSAIVGDPDATIPAILDSRTYYNYLPYDAIIDLALQLNAYYSSDLERWIVDCQIGNLAATVDFKFGNLTISVSLHELIYWAYDLSGNTLTFQDTGALACFLAVLPQEDEGFALLGTPFLRSVYLAVDNEGKKLAMGEAHVPDIDDGPSITDLLNSISPSSSHIKSSSTSSSSSSHVSSSSSEKGHHDSATLSSTLTSSLKSDTSSSSSSSSSSHVATTTTTSHDQKQKREDSTTSVLSFKPSSGLLTATIATTSTTKTWGTTKRRISSGYIPFAKTNNITSYSDLTMTQAMVNSTRFPKSGNVVVTNGEIVFQSSTTASASDDGSNATNAYSSSHKAGAGSIGYRQVGWLNGIIAIVLLII